MEPPRTILRRRAPERTPSLWHNNDRASHHHLRRLRLDIERETAPSSASSIWPTRPSTGVLSEIAASAAVCHRQEEVHRPVLVPAWTGGTKLKIAFEMNLHHTIGRPGEPRVNDIACRARRPFFHGLLCHRHATTPISRERYLRSHACKHNGCPLMAEKPRDACFIRGETPRASSWAVNRDKSSPQSVRRHVLVGRLPPDCIPTLLAGAQAVFSVALHPDPM